jgi:GNAT superfamily N-acetyltransferase
MLQRWNLFYRMLNLAVRLAPTRWKFYGNTILFRKILDNVPPVSVPEPYRWKWASVEEIAFMDKNPEADMPTAYPRRAAYGDRCLCLMKGEELVGYQWISFRSGCTWCDPLPSWEIPFLPLKATQAFGYDLYVYKQFRGQSLGILIRRLCLRILKEQGIEEVFSLVRFNNVISLKLRIRTGEEPERTVNYYRIRTWKKVFLGPLKTPQLMQWWTRFNARAAA